MKNRPEIEGFPSRITIEKSKLAVTDGIVEMFCRGYNGKPPWYELYSLSQARKKLERYRNIDENCELYSLQIDGQLSGFAIVSNSLIPEDNARFIQEIVVDPLVQQSEYRVGTRLMEQIITDATDDGISQLSLRTDIRNQAAVNLYQKMGFVPQTIQQSGQATARNFVLGLNGTPQPREQQGAFPSLPIERSQLFINQRELQGMLLWQWLCNIQQTSTPEVPDDLQRYKSTLQPFVAHALTNRYLQYGSYDYQGNTWLSQSAWGESMIWGPDENIAKMTQLSSFLLSLQSFSPTKIPAKDIEKLISSCFESLRTGKKLNLVGFLCASYEDNFSAVSSSSQTNRLRYLADRIKQLESQLLQLDANIKITFLFSDTDYDIYPVEKSQENLDRYANQFRELDEFMRGNFDPSIVRILPWSRYRGIFKRAYYPRYVDALPLAERRTKGIPNLSYVKRSQRTFQQADYAAQAASLPAGSILLIMEDPSFNSDYDLLFPPEQRLTKIGILDMEDYKRWARSN